MGLHTPFHARMRTLPGCRTFAPAVALLLSLAAPPAFAQRDTLPAGGYALEIESQVRWMNGRQKPGFTPFGSEHRWILIDSLSPRTPHGRSLAVLYQAFSGLNATADVQLSPTGRVTAMEIDWPVARREFYQSAADSIRLARLMLMAGGGFEGRLSLPAERLWGMAPTFPTSPPHPGDRWVDTLRLNASRGPYRQSLSGVRVSTLVGDTAVDGHRRWIVRDSALVRYQETRVDRERTLDTLATVTRNVRGVLRGRHLYDPALGLFRTRSDTAHFSGEAVLHYPGGRAFRTPTRFDRFRQWTLYDPAGYAARLAERRRERAASYGGMVFIPRNDLQRRLSKGNPALRDSLLAAWRESDDPDERAELMRLLEFWGDRTPEAREALREVRLAAGDTTDAMRDLAMRIYGSIRTVDTTMVRSALPFMADPGLAFAFGLARDPFYENLRQNLLYRPPAITPDTSHWACTPEACRLLAKQWETAREPRLRELGLIAALVLDPARWSDTVLARTASGSNFLLPAAQVARGVGANWRSASKAPLPAPGAGWRDWLEWMNGTDPNYISPIGKPPSRSVRFERSHEIALRFYAKRTGRDVVGELQRDFRSAATDSARLVFGTILLGLDEHHPEPARVAERIRSGSEADVALGVREMMHLFGAAGPPDAATRARLVDDLLRAVLEGENPWPPASPFMRAPHFEPILHTREKRPVFLVADSLPAEVRERWKERVHLISRAELRARSDRLPALYFTLSPVQVAGPFARIGISYGERESRASDEAPIGYAGSTTAYLLRTPDGWMLVALQRMVT